jgi:hypothetical protein
MNRLLPESERQVVPNAAFMHFARVDIIDHVQARLRHFRAAEAENDLDGFTRKSLIYTPEIADEIAKMIVDKYPQATSVASDFLLQCALRHKVAEICGAVASRRKYEPIPAPSSLDDKNMAAGVCSFDEASKVIAALLGGIDWECLCSPVTNGKGVTQDGQRKPIELAPFLSSEPHKQLILSHLGLNDNTEV